MAAVAHPTLSLLKIAAVRSPNLPFVSGVPYETTPVDGGGANDWPSRSDDWFCGEGVVWFWRGRVV